MRSLHLFAPWVRRIHLVTAGQVPVVARHRAHRRSGWSTTATSCRPTALPTFNSHAIETRAARRTGPRRALHLLQRRRLPRPAATPRALLRPRRAVRRLRRRPPRRRAAGHRRPPLPHRRAEQPARARRGLRRRADQHDDAQPAPAAPLGARGDRRALRRGGGATTRAPFRSETDLSLLSSFAQHYGLVTGQAFRARAHHGYVDLGHQQLPAQLRAMMKRDRDFFCVADNLVSAFDDERADGLLLDFLKAYFPIAAPWEKWRLSGSAPANLLQLIACAVRSGCRPRPSAPRPSSTAAPAAARRASSGSRAGS